MSERKSISSKIEKSVEYFIKEQKFDLSEPFMNESYIKEFLMQSMLGQSTKISDPNEVLVQCIKLADSDMLSGGRFIANLFKKNRDERIEFMKATLKATPKATPKANDYIFDRTKIENIAKECFWEVETEKEIVINGNYRVFNSYGLAQKLYNMTYKYFYVFFDKLPEDVRKKLKFSNCDCPIDSVILHSLGKKDVKWTKIDKTTYQTIQEDIDERLNCNEWKKHMGRLIYDYKWIN